MILATDSDRHFAEEDEHSAWRVALPRIEVRDGHRSPLYPIRLGSEGNVFALNLTSKDPQGFSFFGNSALSAGEDVLYLFANSAKKVAEELSSESLRPRAVLVGGSADPFAPLAQVQAEARRVVRALAHCNVQAWLMTRGFIRPTSLRLLTRHRRWVRLTVGLTTLDRQIQRLLEPLAAPPEMRLRQIARLQDLAIPLHVTLAPLVPGITDSAPNLERVFDGLAAVGIRHVTAGYLALRPADRNDFLQTLSHHELADVVLAEYERGPLLKGPIAGTAQYLPKMRRQRGYAALMSLAASRGITVGVCRLSNPDFERPRMPSAKPGGFQARQRNEGIPSSASPTLY